MSITLKELCSLITEYDGNDEEFLKNGETLILHKFIDGETKTVKITLRLV